MCTGWNWKKFGGAAVLSLAVLCCDAIVPAHAATDQIQRTHKKPKKQEPPPITLPSGPTGPVQQIPLDAIAAVPPQVTYQNNQLTIVAPNSTLADILRAVHKQTGAEIEVPAAPERVVTHLGPGPAREVVAELLNGSRFNYVLLGSPADDSALTRIVLVAKSGSQEVTPGPGADQPFNQANVNVAPQPTEQMQEAEADSSDDNADDNGDQSADADQQQQAQPQDQNGVKTPQQMLQEMQQRQMQMQQQQQPGQPPVPGPGRPSGAPQPQDR